MGALMGNAVKVDEILKSYIEVHNDIFKSSIRRVIPLPGFFQAINYENHYNVLNGLGKELQIIISDINENDDFAIALKEYFQALYQTIFTLCEICEKMLRKIQKVSHSYTHQQYKSDLAKYHSFADTYYDLGNKLNQYVS